VLRHEPVMVGEVLTVLAPERGGIYVDCTAGLGGHTHAMLQAGATRVMGLDRDAETLAQAGQVLHRWGGRVELVHADYRDLLRVLTARGVDRVDGILADLGFSSAQLEGKGRGFSFLRDEPLDMRMDRSTGPTAADLINSVSERELADVIFKFGEEHRSRRIARSIVESRGRSRLETTGQLAALVRRAVGRRGESRLDPATRTFQAIRIWVNRELEGLDEFLVGAVDRLQTGGRIAVITFHSLEDRIVKQTFRALERRADQSVRIVTKRPLRPDAEEVSRNPRARSAKLRAAEKAA
jgi:16S rRNA (cytosine1402-N4)-methyltransferase